MTLRRRAWIIFATVFMLTLAFDQGSKAWARTLPPGVPQPVIAGYWDWELAHNPGAAFSSLTGSGTTAWMPIALSVLAAAALIGIGVVASRTRPEEGVKRFGLALIAGGALGNLLDRLRDGAVTDFIRWHWHEHMWPVFNVADAALLIGVAVLVFEGFSASRPKRSMVET